MKIEQNFSLLKHNTFGLNVKTKYFLEYEDEEDLKKLLNDEYFFSEQYIHIGQGSNLLFLGDFNGIVVHSLIKNIEKIDEDSDSVWLKVGAGYDWDAFVEYCVRNGWGGVENLSLIPGEVGAAAVQNIGAYGAEASECIEQVDAYSLETGLKTEFSKTDCNYDYRYSFFKDPENKGKYFITHVIFKLSKKPVFKTEYGNIADSLKDKSLNLSNIRDAVIKIRQSKLPDPKVCGNAGSFFMNPYLCMAHFEALKKHYPDIPHYPVNEEVVKVPAAWMIEKCGLKGKQIGGAAVHEKQPLVIINTGNATADDIANLAEYVQNAVKEKFTIELQPEVNFI